MMTASIYILTLTKYFKSEYELCKCMFASVDLSLRPYMYVHKRNKATPDFEGVPFSSRERDLSVNKLLKNI